MPTAAYLFNLKITKAKEKFQEGISAIQSAIDLNEVLNVNLHHRPHCSKCGVEKANSAICLNTLKCNERIDLYKKYAIKHPVTISRQQFWYIVNRYAKDAQKQMAWFQITKPVYQKLVCALPPTK